MTPNEMLSYLKEKGYPFTRMTLLKYEKMGMIPEPARGGLGRGSGRYTIYPEGAEVEAWVACIMMNKGYRRADVAEARIQAKDLLDNFFVKQITEFKDLSQSAIFFFKPADKKVFDWIMTWAKAKAGINDEDKIIYLIKGSPESPITFCEVLDMKAPQEDMEPFEWEWLINHYNKFGSYFMFMVERVDVNGGTTSGQRYGYYSPDHPQTTIM